MKAPEIRIFYAWLYRDAIAEPLYEHFKFKEPIASDDTLEQYAENYREAWAKYEAKIVPALCDALGLEFYKPVIDVACISGVRGGSDPIILPFKNIPDQFVDVLTHELCHVLLTDNTTYAMKSSEPEIDLLKRWQELFGHIDDFNMVVHVPVHALCKHIYLDILKEPSRLERDMKDVEQFPSYKAAWDYVNEHNYHEIIRQLKVDYQAMAAKIKS